MKKRILFLDDNQFEMLPYAERLEIEGYIVDRFVEPESAIKCFENNIHYDLMIIDLIMRQNPNDLPEDAERAGIKFIEKVQTKYNIICPIIFSTVITDEYIINEAKKHGRIITKPYYPASLIQLVKEVIE
jgi:CheY-like chemotaxis protein